MHVSPKRKEKQISLAADLFVVLPNEGSCQSAEQGDYKR
jgi:hypothetical protein